ncbi:MAG: 4-(cytidine 5'-diphospho)-2-C-methyl-D-erythritol kinase [Verrucomicrobiota bacterium]|nr:4-(cytidine 5'-diphospho)-2-C-methyl-D-erythritol kinase [Verrucomicrobiota bacterium]
MKTLDAVRKVCMPSWAKLNLFLAVTGKRQDGFHEIVSVMAKIELHDLVSLERTDNEGELSCFCPVAENLSGEQNLAAKAVRVWRKQTSLDFGIRIEISKRIPQEAGLGGGSSNAVAALLGLNRFVVGGLDDETLIRISAELGSDCPSFLKESFSLALGRGEVIQTIESSVTQRLKHREIFLFKPPIGLSTREIYESLAQNEGNYDSKKEAKLRIDSWLKGEVPTEAFLSNTLENQVFLKHSYFAPLFDRIAGEFGVVPIMTGSGSCCFCLDNGQVSFEDFKSRIWDAWGEDSIVIKSRFR